MKLNQKIDVEEEKGQKSGDENDLELEKIQVQLLKNKAQLKK